MIDIKQYNINNYLFNYKYTLIGTLGCLVVIKYLKSYFGGGVCKSKARLDGKTVIITGANTGIGKETALDLAKRGARIILACRDIKKSVKAADDIRHKSGNGNVIVEYLDLASLESVKKFADKINSQEEYVHILINNAGLQCPKSKTVDGYEMIFGVNHLGHFLLTNLLLEKIKKSSPSRIVNVSSLASEKGNINWNDIMYEKDFSSINAYRQSKLANVLFTRELAKKLIGTGVTTYSLHPGVVRTEIARHVLEKFGILLKLVVFLFRPLTWLLMKTPEQGAQTTIYCAVDEELKNVSGRYYSDCKEKQLLPHALNDNDSARLWSLSEELTKKFY